MSEKKIYKFQEAIDEMRGGKFYQKIAMSRYFTYQTSYYGYENTFTIIDKQLYVFNERTLKLDKSEIPILDLTRELFIRKQNPLHDIKIISDRIDRIERSGMQPLIEKTEKELAKIEESTKCELSIFEYLFFTSIFILSGIGAYQCIEWVKLLSN